MIPPALVALVATSSAGEEAWLASVVAGRGPLPSLADVQEAAVAALELPSDPDVEAWVSRARHRAWLPRLDVSVGTDSALDVRDSYAAARAHSTLEGQNLGVDVAVRWELSELVFSDLELRANREALARAAAIALARDRATELYFERLQVLWESRHTPSAALALRAARLDGLLRAATGGRSPPRGARP